jgi:hypothetical protein
MSNKKLYKKSDVVLTYDDKKVTAASFELHDFKDKEVSGEDYYVAKAIKLGAKKAK